MSRILVLAVMLSFSAAAFGAPLYSQNFNSLAAATDVGTQLTPNVNAQLATIDWVMQSDGRGGWSYHDERTTNIEDLGTGNMAITETYGTSMSGTSFNLNTATALYMPAVLPDYQDVVVSGRLGWTHTPGTYGAFSGQGLIFRADATAGASGQQAFAGSFYMAKVTDRNDPAYGIDDLELIRVNSGVQTTLTGVVTWQNTHTTYAGVTDGYLQVTVQNAGPSVLVSAVFSSDPTFSDPAQEIVRATWTDAEASRLTAGGTVGFGYIDNINQYYYHPEVVWDDLTVADVPEPATLGLLAGGLLPLLLRRRRRRR